MSLGFPCFIRTEVRNGGLLVMSHGSKFQESNFPPLEFEIQL